MIAYKEKSLDNLVIADEATVARNRGFISQDEYNTIVNTHKVDLYSPNVFVRIGLFILTAIIVSVSYWFFLTITQITFYNLSGFFIFTFIYGWLVYAVLEWIVRSKRHYRSGVDDALLWLALSQIISGVSVNFNFSALWTSVFVFALSLSATVRFANSVISGVAFCALISIIFNSLAPAGAIAKTILPFALMIFSLAVYFLVTKIKHQYAIRHYRYCFMMLEVLSLIVIYASVNYFVVRELSIQLFNLHLPENASITGGWFFWTCTFALPVIYIARGLQSKDHLILRVGLLLIAATVFTIRYYYSIAPIEQVLTFAGIILIVIAYACIKYLQIPRFGIADKQPEQHLQDGSNVESLIIAESFKEAPAPDESFRFGGGSTGGGGATGQF